MTGHLANPLHLPFPKARVVHLEGGIEAVLSEPDGHEVHTGFGRRVDPSLGQVQCSAAHRDIRIAEGTQPELRISIVAHGEAVHLQSLVANDADSFCPCARAVIGVVEVEVRETFYRRGTLHHLGHPRLGSSRPPVELRRGRKGVESGGIARPKPLCRSGRGHGRLLSLSVRFDRC